VDEGTTPETHPSGGFSPSPPSSPPPSLERPRRHGSWALAVVLILVGVVFLIKNTGWLGTDWDFNNWWALFILIPAFGSFAKAEQSYVSAGRRFNSAAARSLMFGLLFLAITAIFVLKLDWGKVWPVLLIIVGIGLVLGWKRD
jgi:hypothetical protein